ncbi:MAG: hypothetical protein GXY44_00595 [Phycisphaerales bacterium]|nr:hypothetical protein [Phycisphaerales bacterium]
MRMRRLRRVSVGVVALIAMALCAAWLMFQHIPAWYRPISISAQGDLHRVRQDLSGTYDRLDTALMYANEPIEFHLREDQINAWLAARENIEPGTKDWLPAMLSDPFVHVESNGLRVAATVRREELKTVLSARLTFEARPDALRMRMSEVRTGRLPIPEKWLRAALADLTNKLPAPKNLPAGRGRGESPPDRWDRLLAGIDLNNAVVSEYINRPFRIVGLRFEPPVIVATLEPLPR